MVKLTALYLKPEDPAAFDQHYFNVHVPLVQQTPGLLKTEIAKVIGAPIGEPKFYLQCDMYYESEDAMNAGLASPEGRRAAKDLMTFAATIVTMMFSEVVDGNS